MNNEENLDSDETPSEDDENLPEVKLTGKEKIAVLLASLDIGTAGKIFQGLELPEKVNTKLLEQAANMERVSPDKVNATITEAVEYLRGTPTLNNIKGGPNYVRSLLEATYGEKRAKEMLRRIGIRDSAAAFEFIGEEHVEELVKILKNEHPQTIALALSHLNKNISGQILVELPLDMQKDIVLRISKIRTVDLDTLDELEAMLKRELNIEDGRRQERFYGVGTAAEVLSASSKETQDAVLSDLAEEDPQLSVELEREVFRFEALIRVGDRDLMRLLQGIEPRIIAYAIRGSSERLREKMLSNIPKRRLELVKDEQNAMPDRVPILEVEEAQRNIIEVAQRMSEEGQISLMFDEDEFI